MVGMLFHPVVGMMHCLVGGIQCLVALRLGLDQVTLHLGRDIIVP